MRIITSANFDKQIKKLDKQAIKKILTYLIEIEQLENPRSRGKALSANLAGLWRYRVADYRIICNIFDEELIIYALEVGHRKKIYNSSVTFDR